jgi:hypothetical protein
LDPPGTEPSQKLGPGGGVQLDRLSCTRLNFKMNNEEQIGSLADSTVPYLVRSCGTYLYRYAEENGSFNTTNEKIKYD